MENKASGQNRRRTGTYYEEIAAEYLQSQGYHLIQKNHRNPFGEIDLLMEKDGTLVFVEVKYRSNGRCGDPLEAVDGRKQRRISRAAFYYYSHHGYAQNVSCRFDVVAVYGDGSIRHIPNAFEYQG